MSQIITFGRSTRGIQEEFPIFKNLSTALILRALQMVNKAHFTTGKLDLDKFYHFLKREGSMYQYNKSFDEMKDTIMDISPILDIIDQIKFSRKERSEVKMQKKAINGEVDMTIFDDSEIPRDLAIDDDYAVRSMYGDTEPAFYRFDKNLTPYERNMLRVSYAFKYGNPEKSTWINYLEAVPVKVGFAERNNRSLDHTKAAEIGFKGEVYK